MELTKKDFRILDVLDSQKITSQRQLSEQSGISLGQVNYVLRSFLEKGLVKIGNFNRNRRKIGYAYLLTPKGIEAKSKLAADFVLSKLREYHTLKKKIAKRLTEIEKKGYTTILFVGPEIVNDFVASIIKDYSFKIAMIASCNRWEEITEYDPKDYNVALMFDGNMKDIKTVVKKTGISKDKFLSLW